MTRILQSILILILFSSVASGQTLKAFLKAGEEAMSDKDYYNALYYYQSALEFDTTDLQLRYLHGEACQKIKAYVLAEKSFAYVVENDSDQSFPLAPYMLAMSQQNLGRYEDARTNYELYLSENDDDEYHIARAEKEIEAVKWAQSKVDNPKEGVTIEHLDGTVNSPYSEFAAIKEGDDLFYSSMRFEKKEKDRRIARLFSKILKSTDDGEPAALNDTFHSNGQNFANLAFNFDATEVYYTICDFRNSYDLICDIYKREVMDDGEWGDAMKLPDVINDSLSTNTQPTIAYDLALDKEILYFVSDREGGKGKLDIWYSIIQTDGYGEPVNLSSINTAEDDLTPFYHSPTNTLYFSSGGRLGMGGYDVYKTVKGEEGFGAPENMEAEINSSFDDVYFVLNDDGTEAYFSSNRIGSLYLDDSFEACCYDIYRADIEDVLVDLNILTFNELTRGPLDGTRVVIIDPLTDEVLYDNLNPLGNEHNFQLKYGREYLIVTEKEGFEPNETNIKINQLEPIDKKIYLTPVSIVLEVTTFDEISEEALPGVRITIENISDRSFTPESILNNDNNEFRFDINAGYEYELVAEKPGYETVRRIVNKSLLIDGVIREIVYMRRIDLNEYLPVYVYFDNDFPNPRSYSLYSEDSYSDTYSEFMSKKQEFKDQFTINLSDGLKLEAENKQEAFFENDVKGGYEKLQLFVAKLQQRLEAGDKIELSLKGYASPKAQNKYNLAIGQRRIWTLKNEIKTFAGGALAKYIESGRLQVVEVSYGEETANSAISDSRLDKRMSVYSVEASKERKAEIVRVRIIK